MGEEKYMSCITIAIIFILLGFILIKYPPKEINGIYGYRTPLSKKNQDTWDVAQKYGGVSMLILGIVNGIFGIWAIIQPIAINNEIVQLIVVLIGVIVMIVVDEIHLRKLFNKDGSRKNNS